MQEKIKGTFLVKGEEEDCSFFQMPTFSSKRGHMTKRHDLIGYQSFSAKKLGKFVPFYDARRS